MSTGIEVRSALTAALDLRTLYGILQLRSEVFVVEQDCAYLDPDGRDLEPRATQVWIEADSGLIAATLRLLWDDDARARIGRVATCVSARSGGYGAAMLSHALDLAQIGGAGETVLDAQSQRSGWYARFGFEVAGPSFLEDGIEHTPMRRLVVR